MKHPTLMQLVHDYVAHHKRAMQLSASTLRNYSHKIRVFIRALPPEAHPEDFTPKAAQTFLSRVEAEHPRSAANVLFSLRSFARWLIQAGFLAHDPTLGVFVAKQPPPQRLQVQDQIVTELLTACDRLENPYHARLARALFSTLLYAGLRRNECLSLRVEDVDLEAGFIRVRNAKQAGYRHVYPDPECISALRDYLQARPACDSEYLFLYKRNRRVAEVGIQRLFEKVRAVSGHRGDRTIRPDVLRHTCALRQLRKGASLRDLQRFLGHASMATTARYVGSDLENRPPTPDTL